MTDEKALERVARAVGQVFVDRTKEPDDPRSHGNVFPNRSGAVAKCMGGVLCESCRAEAEEIARAAITSYLAASPPVSEPDAGEVERVYTHEQVCRAIEKSYAEGVDDAATGKLYATFTPDQLGEIVRDAWVKWALQQPKQKPSWLVPYDELSEPDKEADRQIGDAVLRAALLAMIGDQTND